MNQRMVRVLNRTWWAPRRDVASLLALSLLLGGLTGMSLGIPSAQAFERPTSASGSTLTYPSGLTVTASVTQGQTTPATAVTTGSSTFGEGEYGYNASDYTPAPGANTPGFFVDVPASDQCATYGLCTRSRGTITFTFSQPVRNPRMHIIELGGYVKKNTTENVATTGLTLTDPDAAMTVVSGRNLRITGGDTIETTSKKVNTSCNSTSQPPGCGTISFAGTVTSLTFDLTTYLSNFLGPATPFAVQDRFPVSFTYDQDYGDAPSSYDAGDAARSAIGDLQIGRAVTVDNANVANSTSSPNAGAAADGDTDDGVPAQLPDIQAQPGQVVTRTIPLSGASKAGTACGWIDFNRNGVFDTNERNCTTFVAGAQSASLQWTAPAGITAGSSFARFRVGYDATQTQSPTGASSSGEVEDTRVDFVGQRLNCTSGAFYGVSAPSGTAKPVYSVNPTTGATTAASTINATSATSNAMGLSPDGRYLWSYNGSNVYRTDVETGTTTSYPATTGAVATSGAVSPSTGLYYYGGISQSGSTYTLNVYGFNTSTNTNLGRVATGVIPGAPGGNGDFVFDVLGNLYLIAGGTSTNAFLLANQKLPTTTQTTPITLTYRSLSTITSSAAINSTAFGFDGYLYMGSANTVFKVNPATGAVVSQTALTGLSGSNVDFASCANPDVLIVRKNIDGHDQPGDQFTVSFSGNGASQTGTTTGTADGLHTNAEEQAGPLPVLAGQTFTISESAAAGTTLANYASSYRCEDSDDQSTIASGTGTSGSVTIPSGIGAVITCTFLNTPLRPAIDLNKIASSATGTTPGAQIPYRFVVRNTGNVPLTTVAVTDTKVGTVTCPASSLAVGASTTCTARYTLTQADIDAGQVVNTATANARSPQGTAVSDSDSVTATIDREPQLDLIKTASAPVDRNNSGITDAGDTIAYGFTVTNSGNVTITGVAISDARVGAVTCQATTLAPGASTTCATNAPYVITAADQSAGTVDNAARATGNPPAGLDTIQSGLATTSTPVTAPNPKLTLTKTAGTPTDVNNSGLTDVGDTIAYSFTVANTGNVPITGIAVTDAKLGTVTCPVTSLAPGASTVCSAPTYTVTAADQAAGVVNNTATVRGTSPTGNPAVPPASSSTSTPVITPNPVLVLTKTAGTPTDVNGDGFTNAGDTIAYTFALRNAGNVPITAISVGDAKVGPVTCLATSLAVNATTTCSAPLYTVTTADTAAGRVDNSATATGRAPGNVAVTSNTASTSTPTTAAAPRLTLTKTAGAPVDVNSSGLVDAGDTIAYTFTVKNDGNLPITAVAINDAKVGAVTCAATSLAVGASTTCSAAPYVVTTADQTAGSIVNNATATGTARGGAAVTSNTATTTTRVATPNPQLSLLKTAGTPVDVNASGNVDAPDTISYTFRVTNTGNVPVRTLGVTDAKIGTVTCPVTTLAPGAAITCTAAPYVITAADETAGRVINSATARGTNPDGGAVTSAPSTTSTTVVASRPQLSVDKRAATPVDVNNSGIVDAGDTIAFTFVVTNTGNVPIRTVAVTDTKAGAVTCPSTSLGAGATQTCTAAPYVITAADQAAGTVDNSATVSGRNPNNGLVTSAPDTTSTPVATPDPKLSFDKVAAAPVDRNSSGLTDVGDTIAYTFTVTNLGNVPVSAIRITDDKVGPVTCAATALAVNATTTCAADALYAVTAADVAAGSVLNTARANGTDPNGVTVRSNEDTTTTPTTPPAPQLQLVKSAGRPVDVNGSGLTDAGDTIAYTFTVINTGNVPIRVVAVDDAKAGTVTCQVTILAPGARTACAPAAPYVITTADEAAGLATNTATATGVNPDGGAVRSEPASTTTAVDTPNPVLTLVKTAGTPVDVNRSGLTDAGDTITYTFRITNAGNVPVRSLAVDDPLIGTVTCTPTTLARDAVASCTAAPYVIKTTDETTGQVTNVAVATGRDPDNATVRSNTATTSTPVQTPNPQLSFVKTAGAPVDRNSSGITDAGDTIAYTFTVTNSGNVPVTAVRVTDATAGTVTCAATTLAPQATTTCTAAPYVITAADEAAGSVINTASAAATDPDGDPVNSTSDTTSTPVQTPRPQLIMDKTAGTPTDVNSSGITDAGDTIRFSFTVSNPGNVPVRLIVVRDDKAGSVTCSATTVAPGQTVACTEDTPYVITEADEAAGSVVNTAIATGTDPDGNGVSSAPDSTTTPVTTPKPSLLFDKQAAAPVDVNRDGLTDTGDTIAFTFTITNTGNVPISAVTVRDPKIGPVTCTPATLSVGNVATCTPNTPYMVGDDDENAGQIANTATATGRDPDDAPIFSNPDSTATAAGRPAPTITVDKTAQTPTDVNNSGIVDAGDTILYTFVVTNTGNVPVNAITITDPKAGSVTCAGTTLAVGASTTCQADALYVITAADVRAGVARNTATASGTDNDGNAITSDPDSTATPAVTPNPSLRLVKSAATPVDVNSSTLVDAGDTVAYTFSVTNTGNVPIRSLVINDPRAGTVTCQAVTLAVGASTTCSAAPYVITAADETAGSVINTATASGIDPDARPVISAPSTTTTPVDIPNPGLILVKSAAAPLDVNADGITDAGDTIAYTFTVTNSGNVPVRGVAVSDPKVGAVSCTPTTLAVNGVATCTAAPYVITEADETSGSVINLANASATDPDGDPVTANTDSTRTPVASPAPALVFDKSAAAPVDVNADAITDAGDTIVFTFTVTNTGNVPVRSVAVADPKIGTATCTPTTLAVGAVATCTAAPYVITEADESAGAVVNTATATAATNDGDPVVSNRDGTSTPVQTPDPVLSFDKTAAAPVDVNRSGLTDAGDTIAYTFTVTNRGNVPITGIAVTDPKIGEITCTPTTLAVGATARCTPNSLYTVTEADERAGGVVNTAYASGRNNDGDPVRSPSDSTSTETTVPNPLLRLEKTADTPVDVNDDGLVDAGDTIQYRFTVRNLGNVPITAVVINDPLVGAVTCGATTLAVGQSTVCAANARYVITADDETGGTIENIATATGRDPDGDPVLSNEASTVVKVDTPLPDLRLLKSAAAPTDVNRSGLTDAGDTIAYTFTVTNDGNVPINDLVINDPKIGAAPCVPTTLAPDAVAVCTPAAPYVVTEADEQAGFVINTATASGVTNDGDPVVSNPSTTITPTTVPDPELTLVKTADEPVDVNDSGLTDAGDTIRFRFRVTNSGNVPITAVAVDDPLAGAVTCQAATLAVGASTTCVADAVYTVTEADEANGVVENTATATGTDPDGTAIRSRADSTRTPVSTPATRIVLDKVAAAPVDVNADGITDAGDTIVFTFTVANSGNVPVRSVTVTDPKVGTVTCTPTRLAPGDTANCTAAPYVITEADETAGEVANTATASAIDPDGDPVASNADSTTTPVTAPDPSLVLDKIAAAPVDVNDSGLTDAGDTIAFTFTVTNTGNVPIGTIAIIDPKVGPVSCTPTRLAVGGVAACTAPTYVVTEADERAGAVANTATARGVTNDGDPVSSNQDSTSTPTTVPAPGLRLEKTADAPVDVNTDGITDDGDTIQYRFTVTNTGNVPITAVVIDDDRVNGVTCQATRLEVGGSTTCVADNPYVITEADKTLGRAINTAAATGLDPDGDPVTSPSDSTSTPVVAPAPQLILDKIAAAPVDVNNSGLTDAGDTIAYTFTVTNAGNVPVNAIAVADPKIGSVTCDQATLAVGAVATCTPDTLYVVTEADEQAGAVANTATASGTTNDGDPVTSDPDSTSTPTTVPNAALSLDKIAELPINVNNDGITDAGDTIAYRFAVTNTGNVPLTGIAINDARAGAVTCEATELAVGASTTCTATAPYVITEADEAAGEAENTATAGGVDPDGDTVTSAPDVTSTPVTAPAPDLTLTKSATPAVDTNDSGINDAGDTIAYTFSITNTGNVPVNDVVVDDPLVGSVTCEVTALAPGASTSCLADAPYVITAADVTAGVVVNIATASGTTNDGDPVTSNQARTSTPLTTPEPRLVLDKVAAAPVDVNSSGAADAGDTIAYTFTLTNAGNVPLTNLSVTDPLVGAVTCPVTRLGVGQTTTCAADNAYVITEADLRAGAVTNTATAAGRNPDGGEVSAERDSTTTPLAPVASRLSLVKTNALNDSDGDALADAGETISYRFSVTNTGNVTITDVQIGDSLLDAAGDAIRCRATTLTPSETTTCSATYTVTADDVQADEIVNEATAAGCADPVGRGDSRAALIDLGDCGSPVRSAVAGTTTPADVADTGLELPDTGGPALGLLVGALGLLMLGLGLAVLRRRSRSF